MNLLRQLLFRLIAIARAFREKGLRAGLGELEQVISRIFYQRGEYFVFENEVPNKIIPLVSKPGLVIRQITNYEELKSLSSIADLADMKRFYKMFKGGSVVFVALMSDQPIGYSWISGKIDPSENRVQAPLRPGDACIHDLFISPEYRSQGIGRMFYAYRLQYLHEHGYRRLIAVVLKENISSLKVVAHTGYKRIGELSHTRILFWDWVKYSIPNIRDAG